MKFPLTLLVILLIALIAGVAWIAIRYQFGAPTDFLQKAKDLL